MILRRRRLLIVLLVFALLAAGGSYLWVWPEVKVAWSRDNVPLVEMGMTRAEIHALIGRPPDIVNEMDGAPIADIWDSNGEKFRVVYAQGRAQQSVREDNPVRWATRKVHNFFSR